MPELTPDDKLQQEFNRWAQEGRGEEMERHHISIAEQTIRLMELQPNDHVLDLGCGAGWATRLLGRIVDGEHGQVVGLDISDEMIRRARALSRDFENVLFAWGSAQQIPWGENYFTKVISIESFYYYPDQEMVLAELFRVMAPLGRLFILINLYKENPYSLRWVDEIKVPVQVLSEAEYVDMLKRHTFQEVEARRIPDLTPTPDEHSSKWFKDANELREFKRIGALLLTARKPDFESPGRAMEVY